MLSIPKQLEVHIFINSICTVKIMLFPYYVSSHVCAFYSQQHVCINRWMSSSSPLSPLVVFWLRSTTWLLLINQSQVYEVGIEWLTELRNDSKLLISTIKLLTKYGHSISAITGIGRCEALLPLILLNVTVQVCAERHTSYHAVAYAWWDTLNVYSSWHSKQNLVAWSHCTCLMHEVHTGTHGYTQTNTLDCVIECHQGCMVTILYCIGYLV